MILGNTVDVTTIVIVAMINGLILNLQDMEYITIIYIMTTEMFFHLLRNQVITTIIKELINTRKEAYLKWSKTLKK